jgi:putative chitinase
MIDVATLVKLTPVAGAWVDPLNAAMAVREITTHDRVCMFLATILYESTGLTKLVENLNYSAAGLRRVWPQRFTGNQPEWYEFRPEAIANRAYAGRNGNGDEGSGDGWRYRGRGPIQITGRGNYLAAEASGATGLVDEPELLERPDVGSIVSAYFWQEVGANEYADDGDFAATQGLVNRGRASAPADNMRGRLEWLNRVGRALP